MVASTDVRLRGSASLATGEYRPRPMSWLIACLVFAAAGCSRGASADGPAIDARTHGPAVTGIGGIFFRSDDPDALRTWYSRHLGIAFGAWGGTSFRWRDEPTPSDIGYTILAPFEETSAYFTPSDAEFMVNFRVRDIEGMVATLRASGVDVIDSIESHPNGRFAWILDPEGRKIELWEPAPPSEDPYLQAPPD